MPAILMTIVSALGSTLVSMLMKIIAGPALERLIIQGLEILVEKSESKADDKLLAVIKEALEKDGQK